AQVQPRNFLVTESSTADGVTDVWFTFDTAVGRGSGLGRIKDDKAWTLLTTLDELKGFEENRGDRRPRGADHGAVRNRLTWKETQEQEAQVMGSSEQPFVLVVGGGQGGIGLGARLRQLGVPFVVIDKHPRPGDQWRNRYKSLCLHDPVWYDHMPYIKFPENWPVFSPKDKLGDWLESYTKMMEIPYWSSTTCARAAYDEVSEKWTVEVVRDGESITLHPTHLVLATGMSGKPNIPVFPGQDVFAGDQHHSSQHPGPDSFVGKKVVVIGSNNSAHDICGALWEGGVDVTMIQRSSTHIVKSETLMNVGLGDLYSESALANGVTTEKADTIFASIPYRLLPDFQIPLYEKMREIDADYYARLEKAGFLLDWGTDGSGLFVKYLRRGSGYYIDVGASELISSGDIKLVTGQVRELTHNAVVMDDGTEVPADAVVYATGYGSMNGWAADLISQEVADQVGKVWGLGSDTPKDPGPWEGEERNMWKPTQQSALWFHGGNLHQSRYYSLFLALQLKARFEGLDTPVYRLAASHHTS
ncbi:MAG: NAD(P)/FAD-dependent oxidoreductase, partial [Candidatus Nanopelagicales bacterium]